MGEVIEGGTLDRREVVAKLLEGRQDLLVVTGLGSASYDVMAAGDHDNNYYVWAAMGSAVMTGLGLAKAQPEKSVVVITGDGEALMGFAALATVVVQQPANLTVVVLDNGHFGETGMQVSHAGRGIQFDSVAAACGFGWTDRVTDIAGIDALKAKIADRSSGVKLAVVKIAAEEAPRVLPPRDGAYVKNRFRAALGFQPI